MAGSERGVWFLTVKAPHFLKSKERAHSFPGAENRFYPQILEPRYEVVSPCRFADGTASPAVESVVPGLPKIAKIPLGFATDLTVKPLADGPSFPTRVPFSTLLYG